ncbi:sulfate/molybdate ABC transporter ATP-binding protein [Glaciihabitans sp. dw_435]|uniref:sulfate/molybdate ABC transporter ATP-binding protein n=1 Tax=Glaciihabitans sp. dw_435 TaxID=2720081 RepID=UPI001BD2AF5F|nr:ABC transporter ATP-binding protein [Glaciihabitans sp. dw_435]
MLTFDARVDARGFDLALDVAEGETVAILGPNGAGKSTLLSLISGLLRADEGSAALGSTVLFDQPGASRAGSRAESRGRPGTAAWLAPHLRGVALLSQEALLFPHLSVLDNVAFGPRSAGVSTTAARATAREWLAEVEASDLADRRPSQLSGGQAQRVAIARALAANPRLLLLDEPLAALDIAVAPALRRMLRRVLVGRTAIVVTHEVLDAVTFADRVVVMSRGQILEQGTTHDVLERPRHPFTAQLAGLNLLTGMRTAAGMRTDAGVEIAAGPSDLAEGIAVAAAVRPGAVAVLRDGSPEPGAGVIEVVVTDLEPRGDVVRVRAGELSADVPPARIAQLDLVPGDSVRFALRPDDVELYAR